MKPSKSFPFFSHTTRLKELQPIIQFGQVKSEDPRIWKEFTEYPCTCHRNVPRSLIYRALTECDTVSIFGGRGKKNGLGCEESVASNDTSAKRPQSITTRDHRGRHGCV